MYPVRIAEIVKCLRRRLLNADIGELLVEIGRDGTATLIDLIRNNKLVDYLTEVVEGALEKE